MPGELPTPFLGRQDELDRLLAWSREAAAGNPRIVLVRGEAGIGKSRLVDELTARLAPTMLLLRGRCQEDVSIPYLALSNALAPIVPDWGPARRPSDDGERGDEQLALFLRVASAVREAARRQPVALVIDDVQWADSASVALLVHLVTNAVVDAPRGHSPFLFVLAQRPNVADANVGRAIDRLRREDDVRELEVSALDRAEVHELISVTTGTPPSRKLLHSIQESSGGNPLMVRWLLRRLEDFGALRTSRGVLVNTSEGELVGLPADLDSLLRERSASVSPRCRALLDAAALHGDDEPIADLEAITALGPEEFGRFFDEAVDAGLLVDEDHRYRFSHPQLRQLHFHAQRGRRRRTLHRQIADRLEQAHPDDESYALPIAFHLRMAGDEGDARRLTQYGVAAAAHAAGLGAWDDAWQLYEAVLDATANEVVEPTGFRSLLEYRAAVAAWWAHDNASARAHALAAVESARALGDLERWGLAGIIATRASLARTPIGAPVDTTALEAFLDAAGDSLDSVRARANIALVEARVYANRADLAAAHSAEAWRLAEAVADDRLRREVAYAVGGVHLAELDLGEATDWYERIPVHDDDDLVGIWLTNRAGFVRLLRGDLDGAAERLHAAREWSRRIGAHAEEALALSALVMGAVVRDDHAAAETLAEHAELLVRLGDNQQAGLVLYQALAATRAKRGDIDAAHAAVTAYRSFGMSGRHLHALVNAIAGRRDDALANLGNYVPVPVDRVGVWNVSGVAVNLEIGVLLEDDLLVRCNYPAIADAAERGLAFGSGWPHDIRDLLRRAELVMSRF